MPISAEDGQVHGHSFMSIPTSDFCRVTTLNEGGTKAARAASAPLRVVCIIHQRKDKYKVIEGLTWASGSTYAWAVDSMVSWCITCAAESCRPIGE